MTVRARRHPAQTSACTLLYACSAYDPTSRPTLKGGQPEAYDLQSVKADAVVGADSRGYDGGKRHIVVDTSACCWA